MLCHFECSSNLLISWIILSGYSQSHLIDENINVEKDRVKNKKSIRKPHRAKRCRNDWPEGWCLRARIDNVKNIQTHSRTPCSFDQEVEAEADDGL